MQAKRTTAGGPANVCRPQQLQLGFRSFNVLFRLYMRMVYTFMKVNIGRACTRAGSRSTCVCGPSVVLITAVCQAEQGQPIWNVCYVTLLSKEGRSEPALVRTSPFKTDEGRRQKFCEITPIAGIDVCRFQCHGANTS